MPNSREERADAKESERGENMVKLTINDRKVEVEKEWTLLQAAKKMGVRIPTLCHHDALSPYGSCRLCIVEIKKRGSFRLVTSCNYPVEDGLEVRTHSDEVLKNRKIVMELLLARCPEVKAIQEMAREMGVQKPRFPLEQNDCILCGLCIRACEEKVGVSAISFVSRGIDEEISTPFDISSEACIGCGACARVCPTGAIKIETIEGIMRINRFHTSKKMHRCPSCGKYYMTESHMSWMGHRLGTQAFLTALCPECKRIGNAKVALMIKEFQKTPPS